MMLERSPLLDQCTHEVERCAPALLQRSIDAALVSLQAAEYASVSGMQRQRLAQAAWSLTQNRQVLTSTYPRRLRETMAQSEEEQGMTQLAGLSDSSMLQLVDDLAVSESLESVRLLQNLLPMVEQVLPVLDARMSSLVGFDSVQVEKNPLRPSVFVRELRDLMAEIEPDVAVRTLWLQHIASGLGRELAQLYEQIALMLQRANVQEASYRIRLVEDLEAGRSLGGSGFTPIEMDQIGSGWGAPGSGGGSGTASGFHAPPSMQALGQVRSPLGGSVYQAFLQNQSASFDGALDPSFYEQVGEALAQVSEVASEPGPDDESLAREQLRYQEIPAVDRPAREVDIDSTLRADRWGVYGPSHERTRVLLELKQQAQNVSQAVGLDLVRKLVGQVARDALLLAPVREAVVALEPALLRLALAQPRYFGDTDHPARRLVEQVAQRSFRFNDEFGEDFAAFVDPVREAINELNTANTDDPAPFARALERLSAGWQAEDSAERAAHDEQLQGLRFAQSRQELADQIAWEISLRPDVFNAPEVVLDFLYGSWSLVIASAQLRQTDASEADSSGYRAAVGTLLWSVRPEILRQPKQVFEALPGLLRTLNAGLAMLGKPAEETQDFFDALIRLHQPLLSLRRTRARTDAATAGAAPSLAGEDEAVAPIKRVVGSGARPTPATQPWLAAQELAGAGFDDTVAFPTEGEQQQKRADPELAHAATPDVPELVAVPPAQVAVSPPAEMPEPSVAAVIAQLRVGIRVDLFSKGVWIRAVLVWASKQSTLFMFTSHGGRVHSMTLRSCEKLIRQRLLRPVATRAVVEVALKAVAEAPSTEGAAS
jgi:hypothetical protein